MLSTQPQKTGFWESQRIAKQKAYEKQTKTKKIKIMELAIFTRQLSSMLEAGLPLISALDVMRDQTDNPVFKLIIQEVRTDISSGCSFTEATKKFPNAFPNILISMIEAGEASGALAEIMAKVADYFESSAKLLKKVKSALAYPIAVISLAVILVNVLLIFVIPVFKEMFESFDAKLPTPTLILIGVSDFLKANIIFIIIGLVVVFKLVAKWLKTPKGRVARDKILNVLPILSNLVKKVKLSRFARTYSILLKSGVPILKTLSICSFASDSTYIEEACTRMAKNISQGGQLSETIEQTPYFPSLVTHMARAGEKTGNVEGMMSKVADFYDNEVEAIVATLTSLVEPLLIVFLGVVVGTIVMCMFMPIFQLSSIVH